MNIFKIGLGSLGKLLLSSVAWVLIKPVFSLCSVAWVLTELALKLDACFVT